MKNTKITVPYLAWMLIFSVIPLVFLLYMGFTKTVDGKMVFSLESLARCFEPIYLKVIAKSLGLALVSTVLCLLIGYPLAYYMTKLRPKARNLCSILLMLPMWMNFLLRTYAWLSLLENNGLINKLLGLLGLPAMRILYTDYAVILGMVYNFLPFMVLPIFSVLTKLDGSLLEAAGDLGANSRQAFRRVTLPLSMGGVVSGITMVFMPAVTTFVISQLLGGGQYILIGNLIEQQFRVTNDWSFGSAMSVIMMALILVCMLFMTYYEQKGFDEGGESA